MFFDDVVVPADRILGEVNGGWAVAMSILPYERSSCFWQRIAYLYRRLEQVVEVAPDDERSAESSATRSCSSTRSAPGRAPTQHRLAAGATLGAETSIDKVLVATAEQVDLRRGPPPAARASWRWTTARSATMWRAEYLYSRAATIYGGTAEVQRNIIARRLLDLGDEE